MLKKIESIENLGVFSNFIWDKVGLGNNDFAKINIFYGRNYSGKTTLSRILRALEIGRISDKYESPSFSLEFSDNSKITQNNIIGHGKEIRVFNEDFIRDNLRFIINPDDNIEPFAILGDVNSTIEKEIAELEIKLGSKEEGKETGLYTIKKTTDEAYDNAKQVLDQAETKLKKQLDSKATDKEIGIKYKAERFGEQNYNIGSLRGDISYVTSQDYQPETNEQLEQYEQIILEKILPDTSAFNLPWFDFKNLVDQADKLVTKKISESNKIEELVMDGVLNRWVKEGRGLHKDKHEKCAFCDNVILKKRWDELEKHFDEESEQLEKDIDTLIIKIEAEKKLVSTDFKIDKSDFYSDFHKELDNLNLKICAAIKNYEDEMNSLSNQLIARKEDILNSKIFIQPKDPSSDLLEVFKSYGIICTSSNNFKKKLDEKQSEAKKRLRFKEVSDYVKEIDYQSQCNSIESLKKKFTQATDNKINIKEKIRKVEALILAKKRELNDEEKGAKKVNEYLNNFFGHQFLTLEAQKDDVSGENTSKSIRFEVVRNGKKAFHLSEGECRLLALCYFLAKLDDISTQNSKPIIWIDDPISSLDNNHVFFVFSLLKKVLILEERIDQLFISTHSLDFLRYLKRLPTSKDIKNKNIKYFIVTRQDYTSTIQIMPEYLKEYVTEFNYLFHQIYQCAHSKEINDTNYSVFYNFANNARKFFEVYLYYKYPDEGMNIKNLTSFFGEDEIPAILIDRINNEYSHLKVIERGLLPLEKSEMQISAQKIIKRLKEDKEQYASLLRSIGEKEETK